MSSITNKVWNPLCSHVSDVVQKNIHEIAEENPQNTLKTQQCVSLAKLKTKTITMIALATHKYQTTTFIGMAMTH
jgi:hypothetical protein